MDYDIITSFQDTQYWTILSIGGDGYEEYPDHVVELIIHNNDAVLSYRRNHLFDGRIIETDWNDLSFDQLKLAFRSQDGEALAAALRAFLKGHIEGNHSIMAGIDNLLISHGISFSKK